MDISSEQIGDKKVYRPAGRLDSNSAPALEERLLGEIKDGASKVVLDCGQLDYISSAGLRVVLMAAKQARAGGGGLALSSLSDTIREVFEISGLVNVIAIHDDAEAALASL